MHDSASAAGTVDLGDRGDLEGLEDLVSFGARTVAIGEYYKHRSTEKTPVRSRLITPRESLTASPHREWWTL